MIRHAKNKTFDAAYEKKNSERCALESMSPSSQNRKAHLKTVDADRENIALAAAIPLTTKPKSKRVEKVPE